MQAYKTLSVGSHRGGPRVYIQGVFPEQAGFAVGAKFIAVRHTHHVALRLSVEGDRTVSQKRSQTGRFIPVIDLNNRNLLSGFAPGGALRVIIRAGEIIIAPTAAARRQQVRTERLLDKLNRGEPLTVGALAYGGGVLDHAIHAGFANAGIATRLAFANEVREELMEQAARCNPSFDANTLALVGPLQEYAFDERLMTQLPKVDLLTAGLPCSGASTAGRTRRKLALPEDHPLVGHLIAAAVSIIARCNPSAVLLENVGNYARTASASILRSQLRDLGYRVYEREFLATEWGDLERRSRWCLIGLTSEIDFDFEALRPKPFAVRRLSEVLEPLTAVSDRFSEMAGLKARQERLAAKGDRFLMQVYTGAETSINTLTKGLSKNRSTDPKIQHPTDPALLRIPTPVEHARIKGVPEALIEGLPQSTAHELLGQSVCVSPFKAIAAHLAEALLRFKTRVRAGLEALTVPQGLQTVAG